MRFIIIPASILVLASLAQAQQPTKIYRGSIGDKHIEMRLNIAGSRVTGKYFYDQFKQDITLEGEFDAKGQLKLSEGVGKKKTGQFVCKAETEESYVDLDCEWSRPDGTGQRLVFLTEQGINSTGGFQIVPKLIVDRRTKASASYPELTGPVITEGMKAFNLLMESRTRAAMKDFQPESIANSSFDTNYNVLLADDHKISVEMMEDSYAGGAHPNSRLWTVNYHLKENRELSLKGIFREGDDYKSIIAEFATRDINRRADQIELDEAKRTNRKPEKRDPVISVDELPEMDTWALSTKGFVVYFDFPHVMAAFDKTIVPYGVLASVIKPNGVVPLVK